ncbi:hypothetical protein C7H19_05020 [Aphanothece hegewaldii CCALA 016]|uniref:DUF4231 domain-containing protein n=1 Tax=Aphanothece hegewaldii CCALA 016 TaxID=2107694 RepID=A0A2T1M101_9CHRO|nr:hypothetical protein [Aphanothece hegewaldii]PSF38356.1 hypothetical protein C7H19_05020 [Aphanothece hegewaldii CCALA 016]
MSENIQINQFRQQLNRSLSKLSQERRKLKMYYNTLFFMALITGTIATFLAALAAGSQGKIMLGSGSQGWQLTCAIIALMSLISTLANSFQQNIWIKDKFWKIEDSYGILKSLITEIDLDPSAYSSIRRDYQRLIQRHPDLLS